MSDFVDKIANAITELSSKERVKLDLDEGRGKKGQMKQANKPKDYSDEWGSNDNSMRKRNKPKFRVVKKKAVWDQ